MTPSETPPRHPSFGYRPDVDGLRALAVLQVLIYHAKLGCPGGFAGVDVFFVISGFVITSLIVREMEGGTFSMPQFWERRIRRILPALSVMLAFVMVTTWLFYLPLDFKQTGKSFLAQALMAANFYFWKDGDYFDPGAETKPLLHTWSLAVEEQFYLLFPLLLTFLMRTRPGRWKGYLLGIAIGSFVLGSFGAYSTHNFRSAFYLLPSRAWELMVGALLAVYSARPHARRWVSEACGFLGLGLILVAMLAYDDHAHFPGPAALVPCLGAAFIILSSGARLSIVGRLLSFPPFVFIGLVSYPLYLWHWPLLTLFQYLSVQELSVAARIGLLVLSFGLAVLSWRLIETPFRRRQWLGQRRQIFRFAGIATTLFVVMAGAVWFFQGFPSRFPAKVLAYASTRETIKSQEGYKKFQEQVGLDRIKAGAFIELGSAKDTDPINLFVWGDSHAAAAAPALDTVCSELSMRGVLSWHASTPPVLDYVSEEYTSLGRKSPEAARSVVSFVAGHHVKHVMLISKWGAYAKRVEIGEKLVKTARAFLDAGVHLMVLKDVPDHGFDVPRAAAITVMRGGDLDTLGITKERHHNDNVLMNKAFAKLAEMGVTVVDPSDLFLNNHGSYRVIQNDELLYQDSNHLTLAGAQVLVPLIKPLLQNP